MTHLVLLQNGHPGTLGHHVLSHVDPAYKRETELVSKLILLMIVRETVRSKQNVHLIHAHKRVSHLIPFKYKSLSYYVWFVRQDK